MINKLLIANRGEIACRIIATCRRLGVATVAVYSDADKDARHVRLADEARHIGPPDAASSYLDAARIIAAAHSAGADAVHPGYGFLAENAAFSAACRDAGLCFVGPGAETIEKMGSKRASKRIMEQAGVPVIPGYHGDDQSDATLAGAAERVGFPLLAKASAGGGGKGMRIVNAPGELVEALSAARREARNAFGDDTLILERYLPAPHHVEFQIFGDSAGNIIHLFERDCSIQRRYQKIVEESPSPLLDEPLRERMGAAAVAAARAVGYCNAGTVEFIVDAERNFYFLEMNTRLQVEHPVTEMTTGTDLVEWQLRIAAGEPLPVRQDELRQDGHAIEVRIYAEDPDSGFLPATGRITRFAHPELDAHVRLDTGFEDGDVVSIHYDPMLAKLICRGADRNAALARLRHALARTAVFGPATNVRLLRRIAADPVFAAGAADTGYLDTHLDRLLGEGSAGTVDFAAAVSDEMLARERAAEQATSPWAIADGWQMHGRAQNRFLYSAVGADAVAVTASGWHGHYEIGLGETCHAVRAETLDRRRLRIHVDGVTHTREVLRHNDRILVSAAADAVELRLLPAWDAGEHAGDEQAHPSAPMPGRVVAVRVAPGDRVAAGQALLVLEGMKMEYTLRAHGPGVVERVGCAEGDFVEAEVPLVDIVPDEAQEQ